MGRSDKTRLIAAAARPATGGGIPTPIIGIVAAFYASRWLHNANSTSSTFGLAAPDTGALPGDQASHSWPAIDGAAHGQGHGQGSDGTPVDPAAAIQADGQPAWAQVVADADSFRFDFGQHDAQTGAVGGGNAAAAVDLAPPPGTFAIDGFVAAEAVFSSGDAVAIPQGPGSPGAGSPGAGSLLVPDGAATDADQSTHGTATLLEPLAATDFAGNLPIVGFAGAAPANTPAPEAVSPAGDAPAVAPSGAYITDGVTYEPVGTFSTGPTTHASVNATGATAAQLQQALDESGLSVNGSGIKVGVLSDSFNDLGGAAADEADGALPSASNIDVIKDLASGGTDEGRAMMQIIHDIAPGSSLAFYTAFDSEQDFANGILALAAAGAKVIVDDVSYFDEPFFQNGVVAQAIQTVEAEGVVYVTAAGNDASNAYQAAWSALSGTYDGVKLTDAESFGGSLVQTVTVGANSSYNVPLLLEWNQAYGAATSNLEILVFENGRLVGAATNCADGEPTNPWVGIDLPGGATYQIAIENRSGPNPGLIKEITEGDGLPVTISGANAGTVYGHAMTVGAITTGAVSAADTPAFGFATPASESFSSSGAGTELLFANNGAALSSPQALSPVAVSGVDDIHTSVSDLSDFYGTSAAAASMAGVAALVLSADPSLTPAQVEQILEATALPMGNSAVSGAGLVQVDPAVADALNDLATAPPCVTSDTVSGTGISNGAGKLKLGQTAVLTLAMSQAVKVAGGTPTLALNDGGVATYNPSQSTATSLAFDYTVAAAQYAAALAVTGVNLDGATVANASGTAANLAGADTTFSSLLVDGITPAVTAETVSGSGISGGAGTLTTGAAVVLTLAMSEAVTVTGGVPTVTLNDGGTATYNAAHSTATSLVFNYTVAAGQYANALAVTGVNLHGATVANVAGNAANFTGANATFSHLLVDATTPVATAAHAHDLRAGSVSVSHAQAATAGVLAHDSDADPSDTLSVSAVAGSAGNVGHAVAGAYGVLTLSSDGSYTYTNTNSAAVTAAGGVAEDIFNFTVGNGHGDSANATLTVLITSPGETYVAAASGGTIAAGNGAYVLDGSAGNVTATAGGGAAQWLIGGPGDTLNAGSTADTFLFEPGFGKATINNFNTALDVIDLPQNLFANFAAVQADMHASGANTIIELDANDMITLSHVAAANLHAQNFHFVV